MFIFLADLWQTYLQRRINDAGFNILLPQEPTKKTKYAMPSPASETILRIIFGGAIIFDRHDHEHRIFGVSEVNRGLAKTMAAR
jgi:hypothetical protein